MPAVSPVDAATVVLVREGTLSATPWQCYMVRRHIKSDFAADVYVFPGGKVDVADAAPTLIPFTAGRPDAGDENIAEWRAIRMAAIRELFEEVGVLLASHAGGGAFAVTGSAGDRMAEYRRALHHGTLDLVDLARREGLVYRLDALTAISRWITPEVMPRRFDTRFFIATLPAGQEPSYDEYETTAGEWIAPGEALARFKRGDFPLVWATQKHLELLAGMDTVASLHAAFSGATIVPVLPKIVQHDGVTRYLLPGDGGY